LICEVQIRFTLYGFDASFQDFVHMVYELKRKPRKDINWKPHILELSREMLGKTGITFTDEEFTDFENAQIVQITYQKGLRENGDTLKICYTINQGTDLEDTTVMNYNISYIKVGRNYLTVPGNVKKYQFQLVRSHEAPEMKI
jgi:hypothetical protein